MTNFYKTAEGSFIRFEWTTLKNNFLTEKEKRPIFDKVLVGHICSPGQTKSTLSLEFIREDISGKERKDENAWNRYGNQAAEFIKNGTVQTVAGTPIEQLPELDMKTAASMKAMNIFTVEALSELNDLGLQNLGMGSRALQARAKAYIESSKSKDEAMLLAQKVSEENANLKEEIASLRKIVEELKRNNAALESTEIPARRKSAK